MSITASGFYNELPSIKNLQIINMEYDFDTIDSKTILLRVNNSIYLGEKIEHSFIYPNQCRKKRIEIDTRPKAYYDKGSA